MRTRGKRSKMPLYRISAQLIVKSPRMSEGVHRHVHVHVVHPEAIVGAAVHGETAAEPVGLFVHGPKLFRAQRLSQAVGWHHRAEHA